MRPLPFGVALALALGCRGHQPRNPRAAPADAVESRSEASRSALESEAPVADGTLADVQGIRGRIKVVQEDGRRMLLIDGIVQGASPGQGVLADQDALVELVAGSHPGPGRAVVIGLGTGATATALAAKGYDVEVAEIEPQVVELARAWFGYEGHAEVADGLAFVQARTEPLRVIVIDAFEGTSVPEHLIDRTALESYRAHMADGGVLAIRMLGRPTPPARNSTLERIGRAFLFAHLLGSGVGDEPQNLYVLASDAGINLVDPKGAVPQPLWMNRGPGLEVLGAQADQRELVVTGYVILTEEDGRVAIDLGHPEMGAIRFVVSGEAEDTLRSMVARTKRFPTRGDIRSDGPTQGTLSDLAGGGEAKRSDVRMSPVVAAVRGSARVVAVVHPDTVFGGRPLGDGGTPLAQGLPYGGVLYELAEAELRWAVTEAQWRKMERGPLSKLAVRARKAIKRRDAPAAVAALDAWLAMVTSRLGPEATALQGVARVAGIRDHLARADETDTRAACQAAFEALPEWSATFTTGPLRKALLACARP